MKASKKGEMNLNQLGTVAIAFVFVAIVIGIGADVLGDIRQGQLTNTAGCNSTTTAGCGYDYNASTKGLESVDELGVWLPTIALVIAAAFVIGVLAYFRQ